MLEKLEHLVITSIAHRWFVTCLKNMEQTGLMGRSFLQCRISILTILSFVATIFIYISMNSGLVNAEYSPNIEGYKPLSFTNYGRSRFPVLRQTTQLLSSAQEGPILRKQLRSYLSAPILLQAELLKRELYSKSMTRHESLMIIGDSLSATDHFIRCFTKPTHLTKFKLTDEEINLIHRWSKEGVLGIFKRESFAVQHGTTTWEVLKNQKFSPKLGYGHHRKSIRFVSSKSKQIKRPLLQELWDNQARYALILLGTNDLRYHRGLERFTTHYLKMIETLLEAGVLPILQTLPPQSTETLPDQSTLRNFNQAIKVMADIYQLPLIDLYHPLKKLTRFGLRDDGIHLNAYAGGCHLSEKGLRFGHNLRNYLVISSLSLLFQRERLLLFSDHPYRSETKEEYSSIKQIEQTTVSQSLLSILDKQSVILTDRHSCWSKVMKKAKKAYRWKRNNRYIIKQSESVGPPIQAYGEWRINKFPINIKKDHKYRLLSILSPGAKADLSREQAWLSLSNGQCILLNELTTSQQLPKGHHQLIHLARLYPLQLKGIDRFDSHPSGRAIFSWEAE